MDGDSNMKTMFCMLIFFMSCMYLFTHGIKANEAIESKDLLFNEPYTKEEGLSKDQISEIWNAHRHHQHMEYLREFYPDRYEEELRSLRDDSWMDFGF